MRFDEFLKAKELAPTTISYKIGLIRHLELRFNLWDSEIIKEYIRNYKCSGRRKNNISYAYRDWCACRARKDMENSYWEHARGLETRTVECR